MVSTLSWGKVPGVAHWLGRVPPSILLYDCSKSGSGPICSKVNWAKPPLLPQEIGSVPVRGRSESDSHWSEANEPCTPQLPGSDPAIAPGPLSTLCAGVSVAVSLICNWPSSLLELEAGLMTAALRIRQRTGPGRDGPMRCLESGLRNPRQCPTALVAASVPSIAFALLALESPPTTYVEHM